MFVKDFSLPSLSRKRTMWTLFTTVISELWGWLVPRANTGVFRPALIYLLNCLVFIFFCHLFLRGKLMANHLGTIEVLAWNQGCSEVCFGVHVFLDLCVHSFLLGEWAWHKHQTHVLRLVLSTEGYNSWIQSRNFVLLVPLKGFLLSKSSSI